MCYWFQAIVLVFTGILITLSQAESSKSKFCKNVRSADSVDMKQITGLWYGSEIIPHANSTPGTYFFDDICVLIQLTEITQQSPNVQQDHPNRFIRLTWSEGDNNLEYTLSYIKENPRIWMNIGDQRGSMVHLKYSQFHGTIQVAEAVNDHLVLTFCDNELNSNFFTIVLTRQPQELDENGLRIIRSHLTHRGLVTNTIRKVCLSSDNHII